MTDYERHVRRVVSWLPLGTSLILLVVFGFYFYHAQQQYYREQTRAQLFYQIFQNLNVPMLVANDEGLITDWNPSAEEHLYWPADEVIGSDMIFLMADQNVRYRHAEMWTDGNMSKKLAGRQLRVKCWVNRKNDSPIQVELEINEVKLKGGSVFTAELTPTSKLVEIGGRSAEPGVERGGPDQRPGFNPMQQIENVTKGR